ncbi:hypothetical protein A2334_04500 [Candidatus Roizmanbacteria bacterium RIFOXYB2_FULL_38_10]|uniref:Fibronectin type-III domain-containing protein n=1 Tax=Candidatus Roizmanbacteria bacterium RIFOXYD1_FULL_38_12 TaxID=1802093 RepID=A0A1F7KZR9_9BACT|nr:MAG: hypothetical protein A3K47_00605 [Candidatus Roizmanbacteria bacterium RIFOXYA2_FULL_38_14]OGK63291.1 MAG: hypothetical protein A3K27_00605 [Candidatus Roizmanbacteria bacterium RIFOXYA1_FULL_37_12]OGK65137.1 MAG: hypothetical protein A3K38_00605 [Candidatus Roizmanbacteria bacterium RIFOXYB1_FULL_40_23]OGK68692.1 MAG: hypothetical protein A2334_04500 [Candidatus Roizmanbacteria bacterium RIFOXYB2_FULL_38_10]OGK69541.1 MAG: hypothetical protein A3K21_00605 [Candidatus Roizmanbacteria ba
MPYKGNFVIIFCLFLFSFIFFPFFIYASNVPDRSHSSLSVSSFVPADGQTTAIITVTLQDSSGNPIVGNLVALEDSSNSGATITTISGTTDGSGHALFSIKSTKSQTDNLNVTDKTSNVTFYNLGQITFTSSGCYDSAPGSTPRLTSATSNGQTQITLTWTPAANPVTRYLLSYGLTSGQYIYGNPNVGEQGASSYTVGSLSPGKRYYFAIQAVNGCTSGSFSNEISATAGETFTYTPTLTQTPTIEITSPTKSQDNVTPTSTLKDISIQLQDIQPTSPPISTQASAADNSTSKILLFISIGVVIIGSIGNFLYWRHMKNSLL